LRRDRARIGREHQRRLSSRATNEAQEHSAGGSGIRFFDEPLEVGVELADGGGRDRVERVEPPPNPTACGQAGATPLEAA
jgi:hypothetical protein